MEPEVYPFYGFAYNDDANKKKYKIESYDRLIFWKNEIAIDFGDYMYFLLVDGMSDKQKAQFTEI